MEIIPKNETQLDSQTSFYLKKFVKDFSESEKIILENSETLSKIDDLNNLPDNLSEELELAIKKTQK